MEKKGEEKKENAVRKTETFKVFQGITRKSYYRKRISLRLCSSRRQEVREFRVSIGNLSAPHRSFILPAFRPLRRSLSLEERERSVARLPRRKITSLRVARVDVYGERNNAREHGREGERRCYGGGNELVPVYVFTARKLSHGRSQTFLLK